MRRGLFGRAGAALVVVAAIVLSGCAHTNDTGETYDPWEGFNRDAFEMNRGLDEAVTGPVSRTYTKFTPDWLRQAVFNFFRNAAYGGTAINALLQGKFEQGMEDLERFIINSTFGLGGLVDFAGAIGLEAHEEDFDQTLAVWGIPSGPYLELPFFGPHTVRSALMILPNAVTDWTWWVSGPASYTMTGVELINDRTRFEGAIRLRDETALDPYVFQREGYLQRRRALIYDGNPPLDDLDLEPLDEPAPDAERTSEAPPGAGDGAVAEAPPGRLTID